MYIKKTTGLVTGMSPKALPHSVAEEKEPGEVGSFSGSQGKTVFLKGGCDELHLKVLTGQVKQGLRIKLGFGDMDFLWVIPTKVVSVD